MARQLTQNQVHKNIGKIKELRKLEKFYFDTYKSKSKDMDKVKHLLEMANIIQQIAELNNESS